MVTFYVHISADDVPLYHPLSYLHYLNSFVFLFLCSGCLLFPPPSGLSTHFKRLTCRKFKKYGIILQSTVVVTLHFEDILITLYYNFQQNILFTLFCYVFTYFHLIKQEIKFRVYQYAKLIWI